MKLSEQWLREWVNPAIDTDTLVAQLSMAGLEVDGVERAAPAFSGVVVGEVLSVEPHPDADKLRVCQVTDGAETVTVVCGAPNVTQGMKAPWAKVGAVLPEDFRIRKAKLRGVESFGMLCGPDELGLAEERDGLMELPASLETGADVREALRLDDAIIEIDLTPNRGDCLGVRGLAREVGVLNDAPVCEPEIEAVPATIEDRFPISVTHAEGCPRYLGRVIRGVDVHAATPDWMVERLRRAGLRAIDAIVDVTNYVMLELGQPMHAFDLAQLEGGIEVRLAEPGERLTLLDGSDVELDADTLMICDGNGPVAMAGIMGGERSGISFEGDAPTRDVFLECAFFSPVAIAGRARRHGLQTDASYRYERGVDFELQHLATERATRLLLDIVGGEAGPIEEWVDESVLPVRNTIELREARLALVLGMHIAPDAVEQMLARLGFPVVATQQTDAGRVWSVRAPSFRFDIEREADLIEEVARIHGYDDIAVALPAARLHLAPTREREVGPQALREALVGAGCQETISYSFVDAALCAALAPERAALPLANPLSADLAVMRTSLWPGLVKVWLANRNRQRARARLFEIGRVFAPAAEAGEGESERVAGLLAGPRLPEGWANDDAAHDFFDLRGVVERLVAVTRDAGAFRFERAEHPVLHPGQTARLVRATAGGEREVGVLGRIHPQLQAALDLPEPVYLFELEQDALLARGAPTHRALSRFPRVRRDVALELDADIEASRVLSLAREAGGALVADVVLFDVYAGDRLPAGRRSLAIGIVMRADRTLTDEECTAAVERIVERLGSELGASRR
ncbi:MAG: phenylalanine--tRNA ligase subunit beta [Pseudomonadales bacterium]|jgi:phenylalanyl-tRNA synthetase beta chain|nr:phenylalanine--tRNA ligase subunit beta [Pseudomonadales bacterium]